jgi:hypothetical protein
MGGFMRKFGFVLFLAAFAAGCGSSGNSIRPSDAGSLSGYAGTWMGSMAESGGSMMGSGMMSGQMTWQMTQTGTNVTGNMDMTGFKGTGKMMISGTIAGQTMSFTMNIPAGGMPESGCASTGNGTAQMNGNTMTGTYSGSNTCSGAFSNGQLSSRRSSAPQPA